MVTGVGLLATFAMGDRYFACWHVAAVQPPLIDVLADPLVLAPSLLPSRPYLVPSCPPLQVFDLPCLPPVPFPRRSYRQSKNDQTKSERKYHENTKPRRLSDAGPMTLFRPPCSLSRPLTPIDPGTQQQRLDAMRRSRLVPPMVMATGSGVGGRRRS